MCWSVPWIVSSFTAACTDAENGAFFFAHPLSCQHTRRALSNAENGDPYSNLFAIEKNVPDTGVFGFGLVWFVLLCVVLFVVLLWLVWFGFLTCKEIKLLLKYFRNTSSK